METINTESIKNEVALENQSITLTGVKNARQLGGYFTTDGRRIKDNVLLRTGALDALSDETVARLSEQYQVKNVIDFRMEMEREQDPDREIPGATNTWISVYELDKNDPQIRQMLQTMEELGDNDLLKTIEYAKSGLLSELYTSILLSESGRKGFAQFFDILLAQKEGAVLWHCTYGKDRTGLAAVLLLYALGVDMDTIIADFALSNQVYQKQIEQMQQAVTAAGYEGEIAEDAGAMAGVNVTYLQRALDAVTETYGSLQNYLRDALGVSDEDIEQLRARYLEP